MKDVQDAPLGPRDPLDALLAEASAPPPAPMDRLLARTLAAAPRARVGWPVWGGAIAAACLVALGVASLSPMMAPRAVDPLLTADADAFAAHLLGDAELSGADPL
jgi:hypothetical protein